MSNPSKANEALLSGTTLQFKRFGGHSQEPPVIIILRLSVIYVKLFSILCVRIYL